MAKYTKDPKKEVAKFEEVVQCPLSPDEVAQVVAYVADPSQVFDLVEVLLSQGYEVSFRHDAIRQNYSVCIKGYYSGCTNAGRWLYGNAGTLNLAFSAAFYKHFEIYKAGVWESRGVHQDLGVS